MPTKTKIYYRKADSADRIITKSRFISRPINLSREVSSLLSDKPLFPNHYIWYVRLHQTVTMKISFYAIEMSFYAIFSMLGLHVRIKKPFKFALCFQVFEIHR